MKDMNSGFKKGMGISLIIGSVLMIVTMLLHPVGGDLDQLLKIVRIGIISHSIAIASIPFVAYGFWGLTRHLGSDRFFPMIAFSFMAFGLVAVMIAAAINGLILMDFVQHYEGATDGTIASLQPVFVLIRSFNHAFDFIYIGAVCVSTLFWSIGIITTKLLPRWLGYWGIALVALVLMLILFDFVFIDVKGFTLFIFGYVAWTFCTGYLLIKSDP